MLLKYIVSKLAIFGVQWNFLYSKKSEIRMSNHVGMYIRLAFIEVGMYMFELLNNYRG